MSSFSVCSVEWMGAGLGGVEPLSHQQVHIKAQLTVEDAAVELGEDASNSAASRSASKRACGRQVAIVPMSVL